MAVSATLLPNGTALLLGAAVLIGGSGALAIREPAWQVVDLAPTPRRTRAAVRSVLGAGTSAAGIALGALVAGGMLAGRGGPFVSFWLASCAISIRSFASPNRSCG